MDILVGFSLGLLKIILLWMLCVSFGAHVHACLLYIELGTVPLVSKLCILGRQSTTGCTSFLSVPNFKPYPCPILSSSVAGHVETTLVTAATVWLLLPHYHQWWYGLLRCSLRCWALGPVFLSGGATHCVSGFHVGPSCCPAGLGGRRTSTTIWCS